MHEGILCPGFVNAHCHLELSHLKDMIPPHTGLIPFLQKIPSYRTQFTDEQIKTARHEAYHELLKNGVVAVGDIVNITDTLDIRALDKLHVHSFVECIGFTEAHARERFDYSKSVYDAFAKQQPNKKILRQSIVPHAPYSVSKAVFDLIDKHHLHSLVSIHNQEAIAENDYYCYKKGTVRDLLSGFGIDDTFFSASGKSSLQTYTEWLSKQHPILFVHNTYTAKEDLDIAVFRFEKTSWCLCPNANLYIENKLPDVTMLSNADVNICIGTDSIASNQQLSVLAELLTLKENFSFLSWDTLLRWATMNGAEALNMQEKIGSFEAGKQPGIINLLHLEEPDRLRIQRII